MTKMKWFMKQYWRIGQTKALLSLAMGMLSLSRVYVKSVPILSDWGFFGAVCFGIVLVLVFLVVGWAYDEKGRLWVPRMQSTAERDVYKYLPNIKTVTIDYPLIYALLCSLKSTLHSLGLSTRNIDDLAHYMDKYFGRVPERKDIIQAERDAVEYEKKHPFLDGDHVTKNIPLVSKAKLMFTTNVLRLTWIQELTGLVQDALVFAAVYVIIIFPDAAVDGAVPLFYLGLGLIFLSVPLLFVQTALGWFYDRKMRVWSARSIVNVERNPYTYVAFPRQYLMEFPFYYSLLETLRATYVALDLDTSKIDSMIEYLDRFGSLRVSDADDFKEAMALRHEFGGLFTSQEESEGNN